MRKKLGFVLLACAGASLVVAPLASAGTADWATTRADVNGYSVDEVVTVRDVDADTHELVVTYRTGLVQKYRYAVVEGTPVRTPRVTDIDRDGRDEVLVFTSMGANTDRLRILSLVEGTGWVSVKGSANRVFDLWEGGGVSAASRYRCDGNLLHKVDATLDANGRTYTGSLNRYFVEDGKAGWINTTRFAGVSASNPVLAFNAGTCRP